MGEWVAEWDSKLWHGAGTGREREGGQGTAVRAASVAHYPKNDWVSLCNKKA